MTDKTNNNTFPYYNISNNINQISTLEAIEQYTSIYGSFILTTFGIIGNILSILVFLSPRYRRQSSHFYLLSLALSDLCFLIINLIEDTFRNHNNLYKSRINILDRSSPIICIFIQYARNTTRLLSSWIIVSFTIERLLVVFYPLKRGIICRRKIARFVVFILFLMSLLININVPFHYGIINETNQTICDIVIKYRSIYMRFAISTMITVYLVPMCIISVVNTLICSKLWRKSLLTGKDENKKKCKRRQTLQKPARLFDFWNFFLCFRSSSSSSSNRPSQPVQVNRSSASSFSQYQSVGTVISNDSTGQKTNGTRLSVDIGNNINSSINYSKDVEQSSTTVKNYIQSRTHRVTVTLLLVSCSFLLLNFPYCAVWIANYVHGFGNSTLKSIKEITELFMLTNFCINFLLYCLSGKIFRGELIYLFKCQCKQLFNRNEAERLSKRKTRPNLNIQLQSRDKKEKYQPVIYTNRTVR